MDCNLLKSPMAGDISPPRFKFDKFLHDQRKNDLMETKLYEMRVRRKISKKLTRKPQSSCHCHRKHHAKNRNLRCAHRPSREAG